MLTVGNNQYIQPDYMSPTPSVVGVTLYNNFLMITFIFTKYEFYHFNNLRRITKNCT